MATVSTRPSVSREETQRQVQNPLQQLSGYIRFYVILEGAAVVLLYLTLWFWVGLFLDYGFFKMFGLDWVQVLPSGVRAALLLVLVAGGLFLGGRQMLARVMKEFQPAALALVLERRFPQLLGDRLITAVEMSEPGLAERYGYSKAMVDQTCVDAAERVAQVPVRDVFNWSRLYRYGFAVVGLNLAFYLFVVLLLPLVVAIFGGLTNSFPAESPPHAVASWFHEGLRLEDPSTEEDPQTPGAFSERLGAITPIWFERNVLIRNVPWPRRAHLTVLNFPGDNLRVGKNDPPVNVRVRAYEWVVADPESAEGWRALMWDQKELEKLVPAIKLPELPEAARGQNWRGTVDEVDLMLDSSDGRQRLDPRLGRYTKSISNVLANTTGGPLSALVGLQLQPEQAEIKPYQAVFEQLQAVAAQPGMRRSMRKLIVPEKVLLLYNGGRDQVPLIRTENNEYTGQLVLKDSIRFTVQGEDYYTPYKDITLVPAATIVQLSRNEEQPAYLYYRMAEDRKDPQGLAGLRQHVRDIPVSLTGDVSSFPVPAGTSVEIVAHCDKELKDWIGLSEKSLRALSGALVEPTWLKLKALQAGHEGQNRFSKQADFEAALAKVLTAAELDQYRDKIVFQALGVRLAPRQGNTPVPGVITQPAPREFRARFEKVSNVQDFNVVFTDADDVTNERHVIIRPEADQPPGVEVQIEIIRKTTAGHYLITPSALIPFSGKVRDGQGVSAVEYQYSFTRVADKPAPVLTPAAVGASFGLSNGFASGLSALAVLGAADVQKVETMPLASFQDSLRNLPAGRTKAQIKTQLGLELPERVEIDRRFIREFTLDPDFEHFDVQPYKLMVDEKTVQPHYRLKLSVTARDSNVESGPGLGRSKEQFNLLIVSENELIVEIAREEEELHIKLRDAVNQLRDNRLRLERIQSELSSLNPNEFAVKLEDAVGISNTVSKGNDVCGNIFSDYRRILKELRANRIQKAYIDRVSNKVCDPLEDIRNEDFPDLEASLREFIKTLEKRQKDPAAASKAMNDFTRLLARLDQVLAHMAAITQLNDLIAQLVALEKEEVAQLEVLAKVRAKLEQELIDEILNPKKPPEKKP